MLRVGLEEGYSGEIPAGFNGIEDEKMKDLMKDYYTNISRASRSMHNSITSHKYSLSGGRGAGKIEDVLAEISAVQTYQDSQDSLQASGM